MGWAWLRREVPRPLSEGVGAVFSEVRMWRWRVSAVGVRQNCVVTESRGEGLGLNPLTDCVAFGRLLNHGALISSFNGKTNKRARGIVTVGGPVSKVPGVKLAH